MGTSRTANMAEKFMFTSESVNEGHPDKLADQVSDAIVDACFAQDPDSHVACETCTGTNFVMIFGEITTKAVIHTADGEHMVVVHFPARTPPRWTDPLHTTAAGSQSRSLPLACASAAWCRCRMQSVFRRLSPCMSMLTAQAEPRATLICSRLSTPTSTCVPVCWCVSSTCSSPSTKRLLAMDTSEMLPVKRTPTSPGRSPSPSKLDRSTLKLVNKPVITMKK